MAPSIKNTWSKELDLTKTQLVVFFVILLLAVDSINPVKIFLHVFPTVQPWHVATVSILLMVYVFISEMKALLYFSVSIFFQSILSIFFREVETIGRDNIPKYGPVIFTGNHANQFIDGVTILCTCQHKISYLIAEKSWKRRVIGDLAWALDAVPVKRAQDAAIRGRGRLSFTVMSPELIKVQGFDTDFESDLKEGDKIRPPGTAVALKIKKIEGPNSMVVDGVAAEGLNLPDSPVEFDVLKHVDQKVVYEKVLDKLASGGSIGIFPEGGSHDRADLLPLKVGVALIAYSALEKDGLLVPILPVGLNYFNPHRFRGRAIVEYGPATYVDPSTLKAFQAGGAERRRVCNELLERIQDSMKSVIVSAPDYETLQMIHTARRLYQQKQLHAQEKQDLSRRFAEGYKQLILRTEGKPPQEWIDLQDRIMAYQRELKDLGIRDYQVPGLDREKYDMDGDTVLREMRLPYQIGHILLLLALAAIPTTFLNLPVGLLSSLYAERRRKIALAKSKVKVRGMDVKMTERVVFCIVAVPTLWFVYGFLMWSLTDLDASSLALFIMSMPLFSYMGVIVAEAGMVDWKQLRPFVMRLFPSARRRIAALPNTRKELQRDLRRFIKKLGPSLGELYYGKKLDWTAIQENSRRASEGEPKKSK